METPEHEVVAAAQGDRDAFAALVERHWAPMVRLARSVVGDGDGEDVVQEALVIAWRKLPRLLDPGRFAAWLARIVFRHSLRWARRRRPTVPLANGWHPSHTPDPGAALAVWQVLSRLAPRQRAVLHLTVAEGMTDKEISSLLGIAAASVRVHRQRARARVAKILGGITT